MAIACALSSFLLSQFDDAPGVLFLLSHLEPTEEPAPHSFYFCISLFLSSYLFFFCILLPSFPMFIIFASRKHPQKSPFIVLRKGLCSHKGLLYALPPFLLSALTQTVSGWSLVWHPPSLPSSSDRRRWREGVVGREEAQWELCQWPAVLKGCQVGKSASCHNESTWQCRQSRCVFARIYGECVRHIYGMFMRVWIQACQTDSCEEINKT